MVQHICTASLPNLRPITTSVETRDQWMILDTQPVSTNMTGWKTQPFEDVSPIQNGDCLLAVLIFWVVNLIIDLALSDWELLKKTAGIRNWIEKLNWWGHLCPSLGLSHKVCWLNHLKCGDLYFTSFFTQMRSLLSPHVASFLEAVTSIAVIAQSCLIQIENITNGNK